MLASCVIGREQWRAAFDVLMLSHRGRREKAARHDELTMVGFVLLVRKG